MVSATNQIFQATSVHAALIELNFKWRDLLYTTVALPFNMQAQTQSNWCWAATSTSTSLFYRPASTWTQCSVASAELGLSCCNSPLPGGCNVPWYLDRALTRTQNFVSFTGPISFAAVQAEINAGRVLGARIGWAGGGGHFMVIYGCSTVGGVQYFNIDDPIYGKSNPTVATFSNNYQGSGTWTTTYFTKAAPLVIKFNLPEITPEMLRRIRLVRPLLIAQSGSAGGFEEAAMATEGALGLPHPIHVLGLDALVQAAGPRRRAAAAGGAGGRPEAVRVMETRDGRFAGFYDVSADTDVPEVLQIGPADNEYGALLERGIKAASAWADRSDSEAGLRLLRIPALYTEAIVLDRDGEEAAVVIRSPQEGVPLFEPIPLAELMDRLREPARAILGDDDPLKGA